MNDVRDVWEKLENGCSEKWECPCRFHRVSRKNNTAFAAAANYIDFCPAGIHLLVEDIPA
jgi:hypothetical protein